jgi:hypothetical protein
MGPRGARGSSVGARQRKGEFAVVYEKKFLITIEQSTSLLSTTLQDFHSHRRDFIGKERNILGRSFPAISSIVNVEPNEQRLPALLLS